MTALALLLFVTQAAPAAGDPLAEARAILARFRREPRVSEVQTEAIRAARLGADESDSWRSRVNLAPILPELRARATHALDRDESLALEPGSADRFDVDTGRGWILEARAEWQLSRLVWDPDEVGIGREASARGERRDDLAEKVAHLYFERRRRQVVRILSPPATREAAVEAELAIEELTAALDGLTGGWYRAALRHSGAAP